MSDALPATEPPAAKRVVRLLLLVAVFLLPFELPLTELMHGLLFRRIGGWYLLVHPFTAVIILLFASGIWRPRRSDLWLVLCGFGIVLSTFVLNGNMEWAVRYAWLGLVSISAMSRAAGDKQLLAALALGMGLWALVGLGFYAFYFAEYPLPAETLPERIMTLRSPGAYVANSSLFFQYLGNMNKAANFAVLAALLSLYCRMAGTLRRAAYILVQGLMAAILFITLSRGALVVCALLAIGLLVTSIWVKAIGNAQLRPAALMLLIPVVASLSAPEFRSYWTQLDTVETRVLMAKAAVEGETAPQRADLGNLEPAPSPTSSPSAAVAKPPSATAPAARVLLGYGVGNYGSANFNDPIRGTHNLFVDLWTDGGLLAVAAFGAYLIVNLWRVRKPASMMEAAGLIGAAGILSVAVLAFREYDLAYLFATSLGGVFVGLFCGLATERKAADADRTYSSP